jgi:hypothetical protein
MAIPRSLLIASDKLVGDIFEIFADDLRLWADT